MAKKLPKAQRGIDPGFSQPGRSTRRPNDPGMSRPGTNIPNNDPGFARGSKKDFIRGVSEGIIDSAKPKRPEPKTMDELLKYLNENRTYEESIRQLKKGGPVTALDQVQRMHSKNKK
jgi:hypothetical protein